MHASDKILWNVTFIDSLKIITQKNKIVIALFTSYKFKNRKIVSRCYSLSWRLTRLPFINQKIRFDGDKSVSRKVFHIALHFYREVSESRAEEKWRPGKRMSSYIETRSFVLIGEQKQKFAGWKYHSIPVKYKPTETNASSAVRVQTDSKLSDRDTFAL